MNAKPTGPWKPTGQWWAGGIWGVGAVVAMGVFEQLAPGVIDFSAAIATGVPLGSAVTLLAMQLGAWVRGGR